MALISAKTILTSISLFHITLGFFFLTNPVTIADQALVFILGEAMGMVSACVVAPRGMSALLSHRADLANSPMHAASRPSRRRWPFWRSCWPSWE
jgi:hypothetical protein